ncbi:MAG: phosphatase domain-containing protein, partial [Rubripirellula sp.]
MPRIACRVAPMIVLIGVLTSPFAPEANSMSPPPTNLKSDEVIIFFPTYGRFDSEQNQWVAYVHGNVHEPEMSSTKRSALIATLKSAANASVGIEDERFVEERLRPFVVDNERNKSVTIRVNGTECDAGTSGTNGHFSNQIALNSEVAARSSSGKSATLDYSAVLPDDDTRLFSGQIHLIPPNGLSVISDIDDTIKLSQVTDKSELIRNTFFREFRDVAGMSDIYASMAERGVAFHYVS